METTRLDRFARRIAGRRPPRRVAVAADGGGAAVLGGNTMPDAVQAGVPAGELPSLLFVQSFRRGRFTPHPDDPTAYTLTLADGIGQTVYFSNRPQRIAGALPTPSFFAQLGFDADNPPNAALVLRTPAGETDVVVLELIDPHYDATTHTATYETRILADYARFGATFHDVPLTEAAHLPQEFGAAGLFIDSGTMEVPGCEGCTTYCYTSVDPDKHAIHGACCPCINLSCQQCVIYTNTTPPTAGCQNLCPAGKRVCTSNGCV